MPRAYYLLGLVFTLSFMAVSTRAVEAQEVLTLDRALMEALQRNPALAVDRNLPAIAAGTLRQARVYPFNPELELEGSAGRARGIEENERRGINNKAIGMSQTIPIAGQRRYRVEAAQAGLIRAEDLVRESERLVIGEVIRAFGELLVAQDRVRLASDAARIAGQLREIAGKLFDAGDAPQLDVLRAEVELNKAENRLTSDHRDLRTAQRELGVLLGWSVDREVRAEAPLVIPAPAGEVGALQQAALARRPDLAAAKAALRTAEAELRLVRSERLFPELKVGMRYEEGREFDSTSRAGLLMLSVPLPLFNRRQGDLERAAAELRQVSATVNQVQQRILKEVAAAHDQALASRQIMDAHLNRILPTQDRNLRLLLEGYDLGELRITDVLIGQRELVEARDAYLDAVTAANAAAGELYQAINARP